MNPIQIRMLSGAAAGRVRVFDEPQLSFGRTPDNTIVIESPHASRQHGALVFDEDGWHVLNASPNGTTVNGKAVGRKKTVLKTGDTIGVANQPLFSVEILAAPANEQPEPAPFASANFSAPAESAASTAAASIAAAQKKKARLWMGLGGYFLAILLVFVVVKLVSNPNTGNGNQQAPQLSREQIAESITRPIHLNKDERMARECLHEARQQYQRAGTEPTALYQAYLNFKKAGAYSDGEVYQGSLAFREYKKCEDELIQQVFDIYTRGYTQLRGGQAQQAAATFQHLLRMYPDSQSEVFSNATRQLAVARRRSDQ